MLPSAIVQCPYCGESIELLIDETDDDQQYIEDCHVCCRPIRVNVGLHDEGPEVRVSGENE